MARKKYLRNFKIISLMLLFGLIAPFGVQVSNNLYQDVLNALANSDREFIEVGGFSIEPTQKKKLPYI